MGEINLTSSYQFDAITMGFTDDKQLYTKVLFVKKTVPLNDVSSIILKEAALSDKLQLNIKINKNGKESLFQVVQFDRTDDNGKKFLEELKLKVPSPLVWTNKTEDAEVATQGIGGKRTYPIQFWMFITKTMAGMSRGMQITMNYGLFCLLIIPIPLFIYVIAAGCYRITTTDDGITIKKLFGSFFSWNDVDRIEVVRYNIVITSYGVKSNEAFLLACTLYSSGGKTKKFIIRTKEGKAFVHDMVERKKMSAEVEKIFI
ncbi:MAG TPA: hypothetical protein VK890_07005 [Bacteroidia bacterium]|jgi:hypothetical protein|nr:hypothetical protein [Bacteroidia bacterium]